ncbi:M48 family metalloprotease [Sphingomonas sp. 28-62-20]|uniref:M48 family metalloprotease n=1 Tax=Sphingomonas sp. 28-62-20 TaxID=1970433 RepID=UPI00269514AF
MIVRSKPINLLMCLVLIEACLAGSFSAAESATRKSRKSVAIALKTPAAPSIPPILPDLPLPPTAEFQPTPVDGKTIELAALIKSHKSHDYVPEQMKVLSRYDIPANKREAYANDKDFSGMDAPRMERYMTKVANRLLDCWKGNRPPILIMVTSDSDSSAFAFDSGVIRLSAGFLDSIQNTDELAFALAHEIAHILAEHEARRNAFSTTIEKAVGIMTSAAIIGKELKFSNTANGMDVGFRSEFGSTDILLSGYSARSLAADVLIPFRKTKQEYQADRLAYDLVICAKFDESAAPNTLTQLGDAEIPDLRGMILAAKLGSDFVANQIVKPKDDDDIGSQLLQLGAKVGLQSLFGAGVDAMAKKIKRDMGGAKRGAKLAEYVTKAYKKSDTISDPKPDKSYHQLKQDPYWQSMMSIVKVVSPIHNRLKSASLEKSPGNPVTITPVDFAQWSTLPTDPRIPLSYMIVGTANMANGQNLAAARALEAGSRSHWGFRHLLIDSGRIHYANNDMVGLTKAIERGRERLGNIPEILPLDLRLANLKQQPIEVEKIAAQCLIKGGDELYKSCVEPLNYDPACAPKTPEGKKELESATSGRQMGNLFNLPGMIDARASTETDSKPLLSCLKPAMKMAPKKG